MNTLDIIPAVTRETSFDPWMEAALDLEQAAQTLDLEPWIVERLRNCESESVSNLLLQGDDGSAHITRALHVAYTNTYPRRACELRISPDAGLHSTRAAAMRMTLAAALFAIDISGSATTLAANPAELSEHELHALVDAYAKISLVAPGTVDAESGSVVIAAAGVNDYVLAWRANANSSRHISASDCLAAAALALAHIIRKFHASQRLAKDLPRSLRFAIQGFGEFERALARELVRKGGTFVGVSDVSGGVMDTGGLDTRAIERHLEREELILGYRDAAAISKAELLACECDVLILAAGERNLTADQIGAELVVECAPNSLERVAFAGSHKAGASRVLPYLFTLGLRLAAAVQQHDSNSLSSQHRRQAELKIAASHALDALRRCATEHDVSLAEAAPILAVSRLSRHLRLRGV